MEICRGMFSWSPCALNTLWLAFVHFKCPFQAKENNTNDLTEFQTVKTFPWIRAARHAKVPSQNINFNQQQPNVGKGCKIEKHIQKQADLLIILLYGRAIWSQARRGGRPIRRNGAEMKKWSMSSCQKHGRWAASGGVPRVWPVTTNIFLWLHWLTMIMA